MVHRVKPYYGIDMKTIAVCIHFSFQIKYWLAFFNFEQPGNIAGAPHCFQSLFSASYKNLIMVSQGFEQRFILQGSACKPWQVEVGQVVNVIKYGLFIHETQPLQIYATRFSFSFTDFEWKVFDPIADYRFL